MANKILTHEETPITFKASGGTALFTPTSLGNGAGRVSDQHDRGSAARATRYEWRASTKTASALAVGSAVELYLATGDGTTVDGAVGTADAALASADKRRNLLPLGSIIADAASTGPFNASGIVTVTSRYISAVWYNNSAQALSGTAGDHLFALTPMPDEVQ